VEFESCTLTCDGGMLSRSRLCIEPHPQNGGKECVGYSIEYADCNTQPCPKSNCNLLKARKNFNIVGLNTKFMHLLVL
jgi:hypothetical protein